ncbi:proline-rich protein 36-like [Panthera pardus]|uniref:Proline-rich protein 36-like n=1 Tax=Panthera pardus TaxID=9691 RepID=A0A9W2VYK4_PANPR|nr:proline-rich protein 36-like [Panthera pardus]
MFVNKAVRVHALLEAYLLAQSLCFYKEVVLLSRHKGREQAADPSLQTSQHESCCQDLNTFLGSQCTCGNPEKDYFQPLKSDLHWHEKQSCTFVFVLRAEGAKPPPAASAHSHRSCQGPQQPLAPRPWLGPGCEAGRFGLYDSFKSKQRVIMLKIGNLAATGGCRMELELLQSLVPRELSVFDWSGPVYIVGAPGMQKAGSPPWQMLESTDCTCSEVQRGPASSCAQPRLLVHGLEDPPGVTAASELLCPPLLDTTRRAEGVGLGAPNARVRAELRPAFLEPTFRLPGKRLQQSEPGLRTTERPGWRARVPVRTCPHLAVGPPPLRLPLSAETPPGRGAPSRPLGPSFVPGLSADTRARPSCTWAAPAWGATPRAAKRTFPGAAAACAPRAHPHPPASAFPAWAPSSPPAGAPASPLTPHFSENPGGAALRRRSKGVFGGPA